MCCKCCISLNANENRQDCSTFTLESTLTSLVGLPGALLQQNCRHPKAGGSLSLGWLGDTADVTGDFIVSFATNNTEIHSRPENCLGHHFPLGFRQMHSQMIHKGAFSEPPSSQTELLGCLTGAFIALFATCNTGTHARATLCTAWLPPTTLRHMPQHCMGCHFPLDFRQMHSQMTHKEAFSEPPNSQAVASQVLSLLHFPPEKLAHCLTGAPAHERSYESIY